MATCVIESGGALVIASPQPADVTTCAYVMPSGLEVVNNPWNLTVQDAASIGGAILLLWGVAWVIRAVIRALNTGDDSGESS